jgi:hypothetical protein
MTDGQFTLPSRRVLETPIAEHMLVGGRFGCSVGLSDRKRRTSAPVQSTSDGVASFSFVQEIADILAGEFKSPAAPAIIEIARQVGVDQGYRIILWIDIESGGVGIGGIGRVVNDDPMRGARDEIGVGASRQPEIRATDRASG